jgi:multiple sugar transport system substrate-binding protein
MYDGLYASISASVESAGIDLQVMFRGDHPAINAFLSSPAAAQCDLVSTHTKYAPSQSRLLAPLDGLYPADELADFVPRTLELARVNGRLMGIPRNADARLLHYRTDLVDAAPATWDALVHAARRVNDPPRVYGFAFPGCESGLFGTFYELAESAGAELFPANGAPDLDNDAGRWALTLLRAMYAEGLVPPSIPAMHYDGVHAAFTDGHVAMVGDWPGFYASLCDPTRSAVSDRLAVVPYPGGPSGRSLSYGGSHTFALTRRGASNPAAVRLISLLTSHEAQLVEARAGSVAIRRSVAAQIRTETASARDLARLRAIETVIEHQLVIPPKLPCYPRIEEVIWKTVQAAVIGKLGVSDALRSISRQMRDILETHRDSEEGA